MYNHFLDTFIRAAQLGSLSKTAEEMFITPSAVIQQINSPLVPEFFCVYTARD